MQFASRRTTVALMVASRVHSLASVLYQAVLVERFLASVLSPVAYGERSLANVP